ncbi:hypothetical protein V490_05013 [Pseudogymnoascus sp. VKM F-3557]|nr:hypothetical protein V490_05013 [Pseudogymnoascus sp. VKM F-3557]
MCHVSSLPVNVRDTMKIDWRRSIGRHGPSDVFPSDLQEDLADGGIVSLPESYHATPAQRRHAPRAALLYVINPNYGLDLRSVAWYEPGNMHAISRPITSWVTWATYTVSKCWLRKLTLWLSTGRASHRLATHTL